MMLEIGMNIAIQIVTAEKKKNCRAMSNLVILSYGTEWIILFIKLFLQLLKKNGLSKIRARRTRNCSEQLLLLYLFISTENTVEIEIVVTRRADQTFSASPRGAHQNSSIRDQLCSIGPKIKTLQIVTLVHLFRKLLRPT